MSSALSSASAERVAFVSQQAITLYLHVHQPWRIRDYTVFDIAENHEYFNGSDENDRNNGRVFRKVAEKSYRPMNQLLEQLLEDHPEFCLSLSITGTWLEQAERYAPDCIDSFRRLVATGRVEIVAETYHHSLAFFYSLPEFERQVAMHREKIRQVFDVETRVFRNTELSYNDSLAKWADEYGFDAVLAEGWDKVLEWRSPNYVYQPVGTRATKLLLKNYRLSDDLAFRFGDKNWRDTRLTADEYVMWCQKSLETGGDSVNLFMDYETFGEHQWADTGIFTFFKAFVGAWLQNNERTFLTVSQLATRPPVGELSMPHTVTWADTERDLTAWLGNRMQQEAMRLLYELEDMVMVCDDESIVADWRRLQTSDNPYYMCTKWFHDGDVHAYFSPYDSPFDACLVFMNALRDVRYRLLTSQKRRF